MNIKKAVEFIKKHDNFLITSHTNVEGDALGSELSFYLLLKALGKKAIIINEDYVPEEYRFLPSSDIIKKLNKKTRDIEYDVFTALDCSDLKRTGEVHHINKDGLKPILNIDHHISNQGFGTVNWVDSKASCCCELIFRLYKAFNVPVSREAALLIYSGIVTDTGSFRYSNTSSVTHSITAELLTHPIDVVDVYRRLYGNMPLVDIKLLIKILNNIKSQDRGRVIYFEMDKKTLKEHGNISKDFSDYILTFGRQVKDADVVLLFKENLSRENEVRVNFRSQGEVDVNKLAGLFGGGGHKTASGCTIKATMAQAKKMVLSKVKAALR